MMVVKDKPIAIGKRGNFTNIFCELSQSGFTGVAEVSYRLDEISRAKIVFIKGKIVDCKISKLISKSELTGDEAINELLKVDKCVVDLYTINESAIDNFEQNEVYLKSTAQAVPVTEQMSAEGNPLEICKLNREEILKKYKIKEPSEEEIEAIIKKAVEDELEVLELDELEQTKEELKTIARKYLGKLSKKIENAIDQSTFPEELFDCITDIKKSRSLLMFVSKEDLNKMIEEMDSVLKAKNIEKVNI